MDIRNPHLALPFGFVRSGAAVSAAVHEQDSEEEINDCVLAVLSYEVGQREEAPLFGIPDQSFSLGGIDIGKVQSALRQWEPRADPSLVEDMSRMGEFIEIVRVNSFGGSNG